jgi:hypothetical protein
MKLKSLLLASACSFGIGGAAVAFDQAMIDSIASELAAQGYTKLEVKIRPNGAKIEAYGPNGELERTYDNEGKLVKEERSDGQGGGFGSDDDDRDDDDRDDHDDDRDDDDDDDDDRDDDRDDGRDYDDDEDDEDDEEDDDDDDDDDDEDDDDDDD